MSFGLEIVGPNGTASIDGTRGNYAAEPPQVDDGTWLQQHSRPAGSELPLVGIRPTADNEWVGQFWQFIPSAGEDTDNHIFYKTTHEPTTGYGGYTYAYFADWREFTPAANSYGLEVYNSAGERVYDGSRMCLQIMETHFYPTGFSDELVISGYTNAGVMITSLLVTDTNVSFAVNEGYAVRRVGETLYVRAINGGNFSPVTPAPIPVQVTVCQMP